MNLFDYGDYRGYIRAYFDQRKLSLARLGSKAGMSKVAVKYLLDGQRHIADDSIAQWSDCLGLKGDEAEFFRRLVLFNKARSHADRTAHFNQLLALRTRAFASRALDGAAIGLFQHWYYPVIAELSYVDGFVADPEWIRPRLRFPVARAQIAKALDYLAANGHLRGAPGGPAKGKTPDEITSHVYKAFVLQQCDLSGRAVEGQRAADREVSTLTVSVDAAKFAVLKQRIAAIRHELHDLLANTEACDRVVQVNLQMFTVAGEPPC
jgi:uncharacterized protein (TIGR02147 family)